jgi:CopG family transcriptional regulator/antitoxin EndoAI
MYYIRKETLDVSTRKLITISVPPPLLKRAEQIARAENRTKSELLREALRFYVDTRDVRKAAVQARTRALIDAIQNRAKDVPPKEIRKVVREAVEAARRVKRRATA